MQLLPYIIAALVAYLIGSIPTGYIVARWQGIDIRNVGSGNIGATNVFRTLGKRAGLVVLVIDGLKGWVSCALVSNFILDRWADGSAETEEGLRIVTGMGAILGHNYTFWLGFKGGKGIATTAGVLAALFPAVFMVVLVTFLVVLLITRYVSMGSIAAALSLPLAACFFHRSPRLIAVAVIMGALAIYKHFPNLRRLRDGTESRIGRPKKLREGAEP